ncbi:hypothetical protein PIB30_036607 [Stylosanthes scabra]|uniref:Uncharacterized protein n=1 Tax=Stylosanthes scabra TaxID=79078 RepID=A0ABU6RE70_9FABA|nr:hypothetical protein [Stylosanthes scabra]
MEVAEQNNSGNGNRTARRSRAWRQQRRQYHGHQPPPRVSLCSRVLLCDGGLRQAMVDGDRTAVRALPYRSLSLLDLSLPSSLSHSSQRSLPSTMIADGGATATHLAGAAALPAPSSIFCYLFSVPPSQFFS